MRPVCSRWRRLAVCQRTQGGMAALTGGRRCHEKLPRASLGRARCLRHDLGCARSRAGQMLHQRRRFCQPVVHRHRRRRSQHRAAPWCCRCKQQHRQQRHSLPGFWWRPVQLQHRARRRLLLAWRKPFHCGDGYRRYAAPLRVFLSAGTGVPDSAKRCNTKTKYSLGMQYAISPVLLLWGEMGCLGIKIRWASATTWRWTASAGISAESRA